MGERRSIDKVRTTLLLAGMGVGVFLLIAIAAFASGGVGFPYCQRPGKWAAPVLEPASLTLLGLGLAGIAGRRWRQRKTS